ncbi:DNA primase [Polynucleobacter sp. HIN9]|uniref:DNA primase n=1 Tax=Polynucleobacter sp. HIN9 TaxID=3047868 RepID=UPI0025735FE4|nr:DNA primase [Polynucleobacter sp. HIN9]BEI40422.1 DNA primase [Polynucleobacter sp. HIN9]
MALIPQSFISDLLNRVDIVDVVGKHVKLKKAGANYQGLCPFHQEKSPSFSVSPTKQFYHCFGCGAHGSAIGFMMEYSGQSYVDAIEDLARSVGLTVPREERNVRDVIAQKQALALGEVMTMASDWYSQQLKGSQRAIDYLKGRGLTGEIAKRYGLGYAPDGWQGLEAVFDSYSKDETAKLLIEAGLIIQGEGTDSQGKTKRYDRFRDRIMFPIRNPKGQVIAFGGRILDQGEPKYLNSPETPLFSKGNTLYGLFEGRLAIRDRGFVLVCEGYMDVVALAQLGFANAVATLGTACTPFHVRSLLRQTDRIVFSFDGDAAGQRAAQRALEATLPILSDDKEIRFLFLPSEHDPDSYIRQYGAAAFEQAIHQAMSLSGFFFKLASEGNDLATPEGRAKTHHVAKPWLQSMPAIAMRSQLLRELANRTASSLSELEQFCALTPATKTPPPTTQSQTNLQTIKLAMTKPIAPRSAKQSHPKVEPPKLTDLSEHIMRLLIQFPVLGKNMTADQRQLALEVAKKRSDKAHDLMGDLIHQCDILEINSQNPNSSFAVFQDQLATSPLADLYQILRQRILGSEIEYLGAKEDLEGVLNKLELGHLKAEMTEITEKMTQGTANTQDLERYREISQRLSRQ